jgi:superfamily I DNA/RNA helicase
MQTLALSHCAARKKYGSMTPCHPSPFLKEIPPELLESSDEKAKQPVSVETGRSFFAAMRRAAGN